jgi:predicted RecA/RadA family phage recombinase
MARFVQHGDVIAFTNGGTARAAGEMVAIGSIVGMTTHPVAANAVGSLQIEGVVEAEKSATSVDIAAGAAVYLNSSGLINTTASGNTFAGHAIAASGNGPANVLVKLAR